MALVALGLTLVYGVLHIINFAHGALLTAAMFAVLVLRLGFGIARETNKTWLKWMAPIGGYFAAAFLHSVWNTAATLSNASKVPVASSPLRSKAATLRPLCK